jgi:monoamine oxidase
MTADAQYRNDAPAQVDVIVVGAGLAGLTAAASLKKRGASVTVLEARDRVGGRTLNHVLPGGEVIDAGGEYVGPTQDYILGLLKELKIDTFLDYTGGEDLYIAGGTRHRWDPNKQLLPPQLKAYEPVIGELQKLSETVKPGEPWNAPEAQLWDSQTVQTWILENSARLQVDAMGAIEFVEIFFNSAFAGRAMDVSLLFLLTQIAGFGNESEKGTLVRAISSKEGAQERRIVGGSQLVSLKLAEPLGTSVVLSTPVRRIEQADSVVTVTSDDPATSWTAKHAIVAVPPPLAVEIEWQPLLPAAHDTVRRRMALGTLAKCQAVYVSPFWEYEGLSGFAIKQSGTVKEMFDNSPPGKTPGVLNGFVGGHAWRAWQRLTDMERREAVLADFVEAFGVAAAKPLDYIEQDWTRERWTRGCPVSALEPGVITDFLPVLTQSFELVHWAGTETAVFWNGFMDGAVSSGARAAEEVLKKLQDARSRER